SLGAAAADVGDEEFRIAEHGRRKHDLRAVRRPSGGAAGAAKTCEGDDFAGVDGVHTNLRADHACRAGNKTGESNARGVRGPARGERNRVQRSERMLVGTVVVHDPNLFCAGARADEGDLRGGYAGEPAGKAADDFVGELVRELADLRVRGCAAIDLADDRLRGRAADVVSPAGDYDFAGGFGEIAESHEVGVDLRRDPVGIAKLGGNGGDLRGIEAGTDEIEYAAELQVVAD